MPASERLLLPMIKKFEISSRSESSVVVASAVTRLVLIFVTIAFASAFSVVVTGWTMNNYEDMIDRPLPYTRISEESINKPVNPSMCGKPDGPVPIVIHPGDCVMTAWKIDWHDKSCHVTPLRPHVYRSIVDAGGKRIELPLIKSQFSSVDVMQGKEGNNLGGKTFIQPDVSQSGIAKYQADVCYICKLKSGMDNPIDLINPRCVTEGQISYRVEVAN
jgi:hypothetical protein